jgi:urease accessory protein
MRMNMDTARMSIDPKLLTLTQWLSPAYPVGAFAWSHGLEAAIDAGWVWDAESLARWLEDILQSGSGWSDALWIAQAYRADTAQSLADIDAQARAYAPAAERLTEATRQGHAFAKVTRDVWNLDLPDALLPVALGRAAHLMGMDLEAVSALYLHAFASNLIAAAQRLMRLGQTDAQRVLTTLGPLCTEVASAASASGQADIFSNTFLSDIAAMRHETQQPRLFQS